ncbi:hypothetical protein SLEP1_g35210 [Rubroshorea leprosula]|uniref:protein-serine/threonine phosphatase n=1 Tax=Rubroshorea leprosula TaxID=152421 RepID=A0AAV5KMH5_9ROSI|nr:hypothetical protein SLEP1_g35210 [Rubroshorea leprosula]
MEIVGVRGGAEAVVNLLGFEITVFDEKIHDLLTDLNCTKESVGSLVNISITTSSVRSLNLAILRKFDQNIPVQLQQHLNTAYRHAKINFCAMLSSPPSRRILPHTLLLLLQPNRRGKPWPNSMPIVPALGIREIAASLRAHDSSLSFDDLHDRLVAHEESLHREDNRVDLTPATAHFAAAPMAPRSGMHSSFFMGTGASQNKNSVFLQPPNRGNRGVQNSTNRNYGNRKRGFGPRFNNIPGNFACQLCGHTGHFAKNCPNYRVQAVSLMANIASSSVAFSDDCLLDSGANNHVTTDLTNLALHSEYNGPDELQIGDGTGLKITYVGHSTLSTPTSSLPLRNMVQVVSSPLPNVATAPSIPSTPAIPNAPPPLQPSVLHPTCPTSSPTLAHGPSNSSSLAHLPSATSHATSSHTASPSSINRDIEPTCVTQALKDPSWRQAMSDEFSALVRQGTWQLVPPAPTQHLIGCKWVFRLKRTKNGTIDRHKARLVAKGFHQRPEQLFMKQPAGFVDPNFPDHVCRLRKSIYGLKQAPRAWFQELKDFILSQGFTHSRSDTSLFIYHTASTWIYFLVYVDDIIITSSDSTAIHSLVRVMGDRFSIKDLGHLNFFLGVEAIPTSGGLFLSQHRYISDLLHRFHMQDAKPVSTPLASTCTLHLHSGNPLPDGSEYLQLLGSLQYLAMMRPELSFAVNWLSQFMHQPTIVHWQAAKRVLRYLRGTCFHGLLLRPQPSLSLHAFSDADWAGDRSSFVSTTGYLVFLGSNPISWRAAKQKAVARSSTEAEYRALAATASEVIWISHLLSELGVSPPASPAIFCDNVGATYLSLNTVMHSRMKHIAIDLHFVRDLVDKRLLHVSHISSHDQLADGLTKSLSTASLFWWSKNVEKQTYGDLSFAVMQANEDMEDNSLVEIGWVGTFVGVYDGHGGPDTSLYITDNLIKNLTRLAKEGRTISEDIVKNAVIETENGFLNLVRQSYTTNPEIVAVGSCCLVGVIWKGTLYVANVGNSRAVIGSLDRTGKLVAEQLTIDHDVNFWEIRKEVESSHPDDPDILVEKYGTWSIKGRLEVSRANGHANMKALEHPIPRLSPRPLLTAEPSTLTRVLQTSDKFLIFPSDGLWEFLTKEQAVRIVNKYPHKEIANRLIKTALMKAAKKRQRSFDYLMHVPKGQERRYFHGDLTVVVIFIEPELLENEGDYQSAQVAVRGFSDETSVSSFNNELAGRSLLVYHLKGQVQVQVPIHKLPK